LRVHIHLDLYTRPTERSMAIFGDAGALKWNFDGNVVAQWNPAAAAWEETVFPGARNDMFDALAGEFLDVIAGRRAPTCTLADGLAVMRVIEAVRKSQRERGRRVTLAV
jgi:predicted dehydrogenase